MEASTAILVGLGIYGVVLVAIAARAAQRLHNAGDFFVASRRLGVWLTALSHAANAPHPWILLSIGAAAFAWGLPAIWFWPALVLGYVLNWFYVAPRLRTLSAGQGSVTLIGVLSADAGERMHNLIVRSAVFMALTALFLQIGAQLLLLATVGADAGLGTGIVAAAVAGIVLVILIGGLWAASVVDAFNAIVLLATMLLVSLFALIAADGWEHVRLGLETLGPQTSGWMGGRSGVVALAFALGVLGIGVAMPGQPYIVLRYMAARDEATLYVARWISLAWIAVLLAAALLSGWCARVLYGDAPEAGQSLLSAADTLFSPTLSAVIATVTAWALLSSIGGQLLIAASALAVDLKRSTVEPSLGWSRAALVFCAASVALAVLFAPAGLFDRVLFAWSAMGAAFGPLLLVRLSGKRVRPGSTLGAMWAGFILAFLFHLLPDAPGDFLERLLPFVAALGIALTGGERRRNPDRADRSQETVHDRVPI